MGFPMRLLKKLGKPGGWMGYSPPQGVLGVPVLHALELRHRGGGAARAGRRHWRNPLCPRSPSAHWLFLSRQPRNRRRNIWLPLAKGEKIGGFGLTETNADRDAGGTQNHGAG